MTPGSRLGRYELHRLLGEGGMGRVWEATLHGPAGFAKRVALKVLKEGGDGLIREARLGGLLRHPHLVEVYALEEVDGQWVCAMELMLGGSLSGRVLPPRAVVEVGLAVAEGLAHAHEQIGLVHLDLKPANLLLHHGVVKVADLGLARARTFDSGHSIGGTPAFMAPEQRLGGKLDARADIYALGVCLVALATGEPSRHPVAVPWLEPVLRRCLPVEPDARFATMSELADALAHLDVSGPGLRDWREVQHDPDLLSAETLATAASVEGTPGEVFRAFTNLGPEPDAFVGRHDEEAALLARLDVPGLYTVKGAGGLGKTRLSRRVARAWHRNTQRPAWFVDLASATSRLGMLRAVAETLDVPLAGDDPEPLGWALAHHEAMLLVLDNFEQLPAECSETLAAWRQQAPELRLLVTSREPTRVRGEALVELGPLDESEAKTLLLRRSAERGQRPKTDDPALDELVRQLDCLPLALELAASRLAVLGPAALLQRLDRRFALLRSREPGLSPREATLRGALDWSWEMLTDDERATLVQCAAFVDGFDVETAEAVVELDEGWVLDALESLVDRSLLTTVPGDIPRMAMLVSVAAYARDADPATARAAEDRHLAHFAAWGSPSAVEATRRRGGVALRARRMRDVGNVLAAARRAVEREAPEAIDLLAAAWSLVRLRGPFPVVAELGRSLLDTAPDGRLATLVGAALQLSGRRDEAIASLDRALALGADRAEVQRWRGVHFRSRGQLVEARAAFADGLAHARPEERCRVLAELAVVEHREGHLYAALAAFREAREGLRALGDRTAEGRALGNEGNLLMDMGRVDDAKAAYERALRRHREVGNPLSESVVRTNLAGLHLEQGRLDEAGEQFETALTMHRQLGHRAAEAHVLADLGVLRVHQGQADVAEQHYREAIDAQEALGDAAGVAHSRYNLGNLLLRAGRLPEAERQLQRSLDSHEALADPVGVAATRALLAAIARERGELAAAREGFDRALGEVDGLNPRVEASIRGERALVLALQGRGAAATAELDLAETALSALGDRIQLGQVACLRARTLHALGEDPAPALATARRLADELAIAEGSPLALALQTASALGA